ncbi:MAG: PKD-like domain-containing protein [Candidatus Cryptobacteroides sp.]
MKKYIFAMFALLLMTSCSEKISDPVFADGEFYIYANPWQSEVSISAGTTLTRNEVYVSPDNGSVKCTWTVDGLVVSNQRTMSYTFNTPGTYDLVFKAERNGAVKTRTAVVTVQ